MKSRLISILKVVAFVAVLLSSLSSKVTAFVPKTFKAQYIQTYKSKISKKVREVKGNITYKYPGNIKIEDPSLTLVINPIKTFNYQPPSIPGEPGELNVFRTKKHFFVEAFDSLNKGLKATEYYKVVKKKGSLELLYNEKYAKKIQKKSLIMMFDGDTKFKNLNQIIDVDINGKKKVWKISKLNENVKLSKGTFDFKAPQNTRTNQ